MFALGVVLLLTGGIFVACQKESSVDEVQDQEVEYPTPENAVVSLDNIHLVKVGSNKLWEGWFDTKGQGILFPLEELIFIICRKILRITNTIVNYFRVMSNPNIMY